ncbi:MAG: hypothetical protein WCF67_07100 [Chitinophagaceae bacterium]
MADTVQVYEVKSVKLTIEKKLPPTLLIHADGVTRTAGYKDPRLEPYVYIQPPPDGIYDFSFVADKPSGPVADVLTPVEADYKWDNYPKDLKGVRVHAETNEIEEKLGY